MKEEVEEEEEGKGRSEEGRRWVESAESGKVEWHDFLFFFFFLFSSFFLSLSFLVFLFLFLGHYGRNAC